MRRVLLPSEERLSDEYKAFLMRHPTIVCIQFDGLPRERLYNSIRGPYPIGELILMEEAESKRAAEFRARPVVPERPYPEVSGEMCMRTERCIDQHGMSDVLW